ncbi:MAG: DNA polymerase III subunit alpha, partial [Candidatus Magasanikbacteria bacterium CG11_big_fil_rev_8_21_14_0_20_43_7]
MSDFVHLHVHSHYSLLDGLTKIKPLVKAAKERGFSALALTDNGSMYGAMEFYKTCKKEGIKPIIGFQAYIAPRRMEDKDPEKDKELFSLILLAENFEGYRNLMQLSSIGHLQGFYNGNPRLDKNILRDFSKGVIALSGDITGEIPQLLKAGNIEKATAVAKEYEDIFGIHNFFLELQDHPGIEGQLDVNTKLIELSDALHIPKVVTRDVHYLNPDDAEAADVLRCISEGWRVDQGHREDFRQVDRSFNTAEDMISRFRHVPDAIENTVKIAERVNIEISLDDWHFADVDLPAGKTADAFLRDEAFLRAPEFYPNMEKEIIDRLEYELDIIRTKGYSPYFLCISDVVRYAKSQGIVESTRGSAAGSLVSYVLGITTVDPIRFKLPFERFLNPLRPSPPDIDTDF